MYRIPSASVSLRVRVFYARERDHIRTCGQTPHHKKASKEQNTGGGRCTEGAVFVLRERGKSVRCELKVKLRGLFSRLRPKS